MKDSTKDKFASFYAGIEEAAAQSAGLSILSGCATGLFTVLSAGEKANSIDGQRLIDLAEAYGAITSLGAIVGLGCAYAFAQAVGAGGKDNQPAAERAGRRFAIGFPIVVAVAMGAVSTQSIQSKQPPPTIETLQGPIL